MIRTLLLCLAAVLLMLGAACGGGGSVTLPPGVTVLVTPGSVTLGLGQEQVFSAIVAGSGNTSVTWEVTGGTVTVLSPTSARFTAGGATGQFSVTARSVADVTKTDTAEVTINPVQVSISPQNPFVGAGQTLDFSATVQWAADTSVTWSASGGSIQVLTPTTARFTAPGVEGDVTVTATSVADPTKSASTTVTVTAPTATVTGRVVGVIGGGSAGAGIVVQFFKANGQLVGQTTTVSDGTFSAEVPTNATRFHLQASSIPSATFYKVYQYLLKIYTADLDTCSAQLPNLTGQAGQTVPLAGNIKLFEKTGPPPPPPTGCS